MEIRQKHGKIAMKQGYVALEQFEADEQFECCQKRTDQRRVEKMPKEECRHEADIARGARSFNDRGGNGGLGKCQRSYNVKKAMEKERVDEGINSN
jgi:hypothetical protein